MKQTCLFLLFCLFFTAIAVAQTATDSAAAVKASKEVSYLTNLLGLGPVQADSLRTRLSFFYRTFGHINLAATRAGNRSSAVIQQMNAQHRQVLVQVFTNPQKAKYDSVNTAKQQLAAARGSTQ